MKAVYEGEPYTYYLVEVLDADDKFGITWVEFHNGIRAHVETGKLVYLA